MTKKPTPPNLPPLKREHLFASTRESSTKAPGEDKFEKARAFKYGQMVPDMKDSGQTTRQTERASSFTWMGTSTKGNGRTIRHLVSVLITITMVQST